MAKSAAYIDLDEGAAPATPDTGKVRVYAKTDGKTYQKDDAGTETDLAQAGGSGGEFTEQSTVTLTSGDVTTTSTTFTDATGLSITMTTGAVRCLVIFSAAGTNTTAVRRCDVDLAIDGTRQGQTNGLIFAGNADSNELHNIGFTFLTDVLSAASHTFKIQFKSGGGAGTATIFASTANTPARLTVIETSMTT